MRFLKTISVSNFRNYVALHLSFDPGINVLVGENGQGKTSLLEAIYFLSVLRSFRCQQVKNLYRWGERTFSIKGVIESGIICTTLEIHYGEKRKLLLNGSNVYKASELLGHMLTMAFVPEDIRLVQGTGRERRRFLDTTLSLLHPEYLSLIQDYYKALKSRNLLLKRESLNSKLIKSFDSILIRTGARITRYRTQFCRILAEYMTPLSQNMFSKHHRLTLNYDYTYPSTVHMETVSDFEKALGAAFHKSVTKDLDYRSTHVGPHRENFTLFLNQKLLQDYGSEGECRLAVLILKMAAGELFLRERKKDPILFLVDDVIGELDKNHEQSFLQLLTRADQVFFACTDDDALYRMNSSTVFDIFHGKATIRTTQS